MSVLQWFSAVDAPFQVAVISGFFGLLGGLIGPAIKHVFDRWAIAHRLEVEYEYEERKKLRSAVGRHKGVLLDTAERLNHRLWNLQKNQAQGWLAVDGDYTLPVDNYYYTTTVYRFLLFFSCAYRFEKETLFIDSRIATENELTFVKFIKALEWSVTDVALFDGLQYDPSTHTDHFFRDKLRLACGFLSRHGDHASLEEFQADLEGGKIDHRIAPALTFFDGLSANEDRYRWDRIVVFHLLLMTFLNAFGYDMQRSSLEQVRTIASSVLHPEVLVNLRTWIPKLGLAKDPSCKELIRAIMAAERSVHSAPASSPSSPVFATSRR